MSFHVNQQVVCVDDRCPVGRTLPIRRGATYTVVRVQDQFGLDPDGKLGMGCCLVLAGVPCFNLLGERSYDHGYAASRFRPVRTTSIEIFRQMLNPVREDV